MGLINWQIKKLTEGSGCSAVAAWGGNSHWKWASGSWRMGDAMSPLKRQFPEGLGPGLKDNSWFSVEQSPHRIFLRDAGPPLSSRLHCLGGLLGGPNVHSNCTLTTSPSWMFLYYLINTKKAISWLLFGISCNAGYIWFLTKFVTEKKFHKSNQVRFFWTFNMHIFSNQVVYGTKSY